MVWASFDVNSIHKICTSSHDQSFWLSPFARQKENYKYYRMSWTKTFCLPYDFCHIFNSRTVEQSETWFKSSAKTRNELEYLINVSIHFTVKNVCGVWSWFFRVFLLPLLGRRFINQQVYFFFCRKSEPFPHCKLQALKFWKLGNITWGIYRGYYMPACGYEFYLLVFNSMSHPFDALTREISSWTLEDKIRIRAQACILQ